MLNPAQSQTPQMRAADACIRAGRPEEAEAIYQRTLGAEPQNGAAMLAWAQLRRANGDAQGAASLLQRAIAAGAGPLAMVELASMLIDYANPSKAEVLLRQALAIAPRLAAVHFQLGRAQAARGHGETAAELYRTASRADPNMVEPRYELAKTLSGLGRLEEAANAYRALLKRAPGHVPALLGHGWVLGQLRRFHDALVCFDQAEALGADIANPLAETALALAHVCDWTRRDALRARLRARLERDLPCVIDTFAVLATEDDPALHHRMAVQLSAAVHAHVRSAPRPVIVTRPPGPIRLGYLSGDFNQHATALLTAELFALHDRRRFAVTAFSYSHDDGSPTRRRVVAAFDQFEELALEPPPESARRIAAAGIDILIDLKGYTTGTRPEIAALRPAPLQVSHLGYPGTMGADWFDYVIADPYVLPLSEQPHWSEQIVHLPHSYQPNDRSRPMPSPAARASYGLPAQGFVFACFNNSYKIGPEMFAIWMELLQAVPGSVLWLLASNSTAEVALRSAAVKQGIAASRLVFAPGVELGEHVARHACADLFLDTAPYGAHTTAADALWSGLPVLTCTGRSFAARVATSLLHALGLPELVTASADDYRARAIMLAQDPAALRALRQRLAQARFTAPLFDAARYVHNLEAAFEAMMERHRAGLPAASFTIRDDQPFYHTG